eukprot:249690_1
MHFLTGFVWLTIHIISLYQCDQQFIYVTKNGTDGIGCGSSLDLACGTLFYASTIISDEIDDWYIEVFNGQNKNEIHKYITNQYSSNEHNPCIPISFKSGISKIIITFNQQYIVTMNDWYYQTLCSNGTFINNWMFYSESLLIINNLIINNYHSMKFIYSNRTITCTNCVFKDIIINAAFGIEVEHSLTLQNNTFDNIQGIAIIQSDMGTLHMLDSTIINIDINTFIETRHSVIINRCVFSNIKGTTIVSQYQGHSTIVENTIFENINSASIIKSFCLTPCQHAYENIIITTSQLQQSNQFGLFYYGDGANVVQMNGIQVNYSYHYSNCGSCSETIYWSDINSSGCAISCLNPVTFIQNFGIMNLSNVTFHINITQQTHNILKEQLVLDVDYISMEYSFSTYEEPLSLIRNFYQLNINDMRVNGPTFGRAFIVNSGILSINGLFINALPFSPNILQSYIILYQFRSDASIISVSNSVIVGGVTQIQINIGSVFVVNTIFKDSLMSVKANYCKDVFIEECRFYRIGDYYGEFWTSAHEGFKRNNVIHVTHGVDVVYKTDVTIRNNIFSCFQKTGSVYLSEINMAIVDGNTFIVNTSNLYYNVLPLYLQFSAVKGYGIVYLYQSQNSSKIINNRFEENKINASFPWLYYKDNYNRQGQIHCLAGNTFTNKAVVLEGGDISSCYRPKAQQCLNGSICVDGMYGPIDKTFYNSVSTFIYDAQSNISSIFEIKWVSSKVVLDNINVEVIGNNDQYIIIKPLIITKGTVMILDSVWNNFSDVWYLTTCNLLYNDRLKRQTNFISKLIIKCDKWVLHANMTNTIQSMNTQYIEHFSATKMNFTATELTYFPGGSV